jgi:homocitrate synthase NifV
MALKVNGFSLPKIDTSNLRSLGALWEKLTGETISKHKPILGEKVFEVESGIHINGILKNNLNYEPFSPEKVGAKRQFTLGKFSGKSALMIKLQELKIMENIKDPDRLLLLIREKCLLERRGLSDRELFLLSNEMIEGCEISG